MWNVVICDGNEPEREQLSEYVKLWCKENGRDASVEVCSDWVGLYDKVQQVEPDTIIVAHDNMAGLDTIMDIPLPHAKIIWFSELSLTMQTCQLCVSWFGTKPVTYQKMNKALSFCTRIGTRYTSTWSDRKKAL